MPPPRKKSKPRAPGELMAMLTPRGGSSRVLEKPLTPRRGQRPPGILKKIPMADIKSLKAVFKLVDEGEDGTIDAHELKLALAKDKTHNLAPYAVAMVNAIDVDDNNVVSFEEMLQVVYPLMTRAEATECNDSLKPPPKTKQYICGRNTNLTTEQIVELTTIFEEWDINKNGSISLQEMQQALIDSDFGEEELQAMFDEYDDNCNDELELGEFIKCMSACYL